MTADDREQILALAQDLPAVWPAPTTTAADRKQLLWLLIANVILDNHRLEGRTWFQINWRTGGSSEHWHRRNVRGYADYDDLPQLETRVRALHGAGLMDAAIAKALNGEGFHTSHGQRFTGPVVFLLRKQWALPTWNPAAPNPPRWPDDTYSVAAAAELLNVYPGTIWLWLRRGVLTGWQLGKGTPWHVSLPEPEIARIRARLARAQRTNRSRHRHHDRSLTRCWLTAPWIACWAELTTWCSRAAPTVNSSDQIGPGRPPLCHPTLPQIRPYDAAHTPPTDVIG